MPHLGTLLKFNFLKSACSLAIKVDLINPFYRGIYLRSLSMQSLLGQTLIVSGLSTSHFSVINVCVRVLTL